MAAPWNLEMTWGIKEYCQLSTTGFGGQWSRQPGGHGVVKSRFLLWSENTTEIQHPEGPRERLFQITTWLVWDFAGLRREKRESSITNSLQIKETNYIWQTLRKKKLDNIVNKSTITFYTVKSLNIVVQKFLESSSCFQI